MDISILHRIAVGAVACVFAFTVGPMAAAAPMYTPSEAQPSQSPPQVPEQSFMILERYIEATPSGYVLNAPEEVLDSLPAEGLRLLEEHWGDVARRIAKGDLTYAGDLTYGGDLVSSPASETVSPEAHSFKVPIINTSHFHVIAHWWGYEYQIDQWLVNKINGGAALTAFIPEAGPIVAGVVVAYANLCMHSDGWSYIHQAFVGPPACNPFG